MTEVTNADLYGALMDIREDIGALKTSASINLTALQSHSTRIGDIEATINKQRGAARVWGLVATGLGSLAGAVLGYLSSHKLL